MSTLSTSFSASISSTSMLARNLLGLLFLVLLANSPVNQAKELPDFTKIVQKNAPAVVKISSVKKPVARQRQAMPNGRGGQEMPEIFKRLFDQQQQQPRSRGGESLGSGFFISDDGYVLTNNHVIDGADEITVLLQDRREFIAEVIGSDERSDLALLKVKGKGFPVVRLGHSKELDVGEWVLAIGSPFGLDYSVAAGIVSAKGRSLPTEKGENYVPFIQTDVAINPGNSGGPLFNLAGEVVGVNSQIYTRSGGSIGLSFAIPVSVVREVVEQLKASGKVVRGWLGVGIQDVDGDLASSFGLKKSMGALVSQVVANGPAEDGGIQVGDVILEFNGEDIAESSDLPHVVGRTAPGRKVDVLLFRNGKRKTLKVTIGSLDDGSKAIASRAKSDEEVNGGKLGLLVVDLTDAQKARLNMDRGVVVSRVLAGKSASVGGLRSGDIITSIDNKAVNSAKDYQRIVKKLAVNKHVAVRIVRNGQPGFVALKVGK